MWCNSHRTRSRLESIPRLLVSGVVSTVVLSACGARSSLLTDTDTPGMGGTGGSVVTSSSGGQSSSGGGHGDEGGAGGGVGGCDPSLPGPALVEIPAPGGGHFCIDSTEVTNAHYATWLASSPEVKGQPAVCAWNDTFIPFKGWPAPSGKENEPIRWVDWCDAFAYCAAAGKRLCGKIGGGSVDVTGEADDPAQSQWLDACTAGGTKKFPYGNTFQPGACHVGGPGIDAPLPVGQTKTCEGGYPGLFDMMGNVAEWIDSCDGSDGEYDHCRLHGGSYYDELIDLQCSRYFAFSRSIAAAFVGIRCCRD